MGMRTGHQHPHDQHHQQQRCQGGAGEAYDLLEDPSVVVDAVPRTQSELVDSVGTGVDLPIKELTE
jgi:hypothetical protein